MFLNSRTYIILIHFLILLRFGDTFSYTKDENQEKNNDLINGSDRKYIIHKCCPLGKYPNIRPCKAHNDTKDFSKLKIYDKNVYETKKSFNNRFSVSAGLFPADKIFRRQAINVSVLDGLGYVIEDGSLMLEMVNMYKHWIPIGNGNFCIDYGITLNGSLTDHPVFFAIIDFEGFEESNDFLTAATLVSCFFLLLVLVVYILLPELQNLHGMILMAYVACLFMAFLLLVIIQVFSHEEPICIGLTMGIYYCFLATFCWMTVMSYDIWWTFRGYAKARPIHRRGEMFKFIMYCLFAFGVPLLMTISFYILNTVDMSHWPWFVTPQVPAQGCFLEGGSKLLYLYMPMLILIVTNWVFYLMTAFNLWRLNRATAILDSAAAGTPAAHRTQMNRFILYMKLAVVMGLNWLLEIVSFLYPGFKVWNVTDAYNILIGFFIFLIFVWKKKIYRKLYKRYVLKSTRRFQPGSSKSYSSSSSSSDSNQETASLQICSNPKGY